MVARSVEGAKQPTLQALDLFFVTFRSEMSQYKGEMSGLTGVFYTEGCLIESENIVAVKKRKQTRTLYFS